MKGFKHTTDTRPAERGSALIIALFISLVVTGLCTTMILISNTNSLVAANERDRDRALFASKSGRLVYHIDEALRRIEDGSYGKCRSCEKQINKERLTAVPHARLCIECKSSEEDKKTGPQKR